MAEISVVIPVRNGAATIRAQLEALDRQRPGTTPFEVVVADNGSDDGTEDVVHSTTVSYPLRVVDASARQGVSHARNVGIRETTSELILVCDADDEVDEGWVEAFLRGRASGAELMGGRLDYGRLNPEYAQRWRGSDHATVMAHRGFLRFAHGACCAFSRQAFDAIDGFDEELRGGGDDIDFFWRAQLAGFTLTAVDDAVVHYRLRTSVRDVWRQGVAYGRSDPALYMRFRPHGMRRRSSLAILRSLAWLVLRSPQVLRGLESRGAWVWSAAHQMGRLRGSIACRVAYL